MGRCDFELVGGFLESFGCFLFMRPYPFHYFYASLGEAYCDRRNINV